MEGIEDLKRMLRRASMDVRMAANSEVHKIATDILNESRALVPFDKGILSGSGHVKSVNTGSKLVASQAVEYGGPAAPYALIQHEGVDPRTGKLYFHPAKARGGTGPGIPGQTRARKYLEEPANKHQATIVPRLIAAIKRVT